MKKSILVLAGLVAFTCMGCTSVEKLTLDELPQPQSDKGLVYFYREKEFTGSGVSYHIYENEEKLGALKNGTFFFIEPTPGVHVYSAKTEAEDEITLEVENGQVYYVKGEIKMGFFVGQPELTVVHEIEGKAEIPSLQYAVLKKKED